MDREHGGVFTCFGNRGLKLHSHDKYTWSQGRFAWLTARLARLARAGLVGGDPSDYIELSRRTVAFLRDHVVLEDGVCAYVLTEDGTPKEAFAGAGLAPSRFADAFVVLGAAELGAAEAELGDVGAAADVLRWTLESYRPLARAMETGNVPAAPYPIPAGHTAHSFPMIMLNVSQTLGDALRSLGHDAAAELAGDRQRFLDQVMSYTHPDGAVTEVRPAAGSTGAPSRAGTLLLTHANPGHALESMWFVLHESVPQGLADTTQRALAVIGHSLEIGWDTEFGGLLRFVSASGGPPTGANTGEPMDSLIAETWSTKLWWPHSEALYATLLAYRLTEDPPTARWYERVHDYVFTTFPNPDRSVGEWIQIRDREGQPLDKVVALPVKDPFHVIRNVLGVIELLARWDEQVPVGAAR